MEFDRGRQRYQLRSVTPGYTIDEVVERTGFDFDQPQQVPETPIPSDKALIVLRRDVARDLAGTYPTFAERVFGDRQ